MFVITNTNQIQALVYLKPNTSTCVFGGTFLLFRSSLQRSPTEESQPKHWMRTQKTKTSTNVYKIPNRKKTLKVLSLPLKLPFRIRQAAATKVRAFLFLLSSQFEPGPRKD